MSATVSHLTRTLGVFGRRLTRFVLITLACALGALAPATALADQFLTAQDAMDAVRTAATAISATNIIIAVVDRTGVPLAVYLGPTATAGDIITGGIVSNLYQGGAPVLATDYAVGLARTGAFFSNNQAPLSSRTVRFISGIHFPPGIFNKPPAALYGIENTNRGCDFNVAVAGIPRATSLNGGACGAGAGFAGCGTGIVTGKADIFDSDPSAVDGGGVPIFKNGALVGGIGVTGIGIPHSATEFAAFTGSIPGPIFGPRPADPGVIFLDGVALPFVQNTLRPPGFGPGVFNGAFTVGPIASPNGAAGVPKRFIFGPVASGDGRLTVPDISRVIGRGEDEARRTRAAIRLPLGTTTQMVFAVSDLAGNILAIFRMEDATIFSIDVAVAKARNAVAFSSPTRDPRDLAGVPLGTAITARTISFGAQPLYPAGIDRTRSGPFFADFTLDVATPCSQGFQAANANQSGIVFFPGSIGLYSGHTLIGGLGVSGDGVEQDDFVTAASVAQINKPDDRPNWTAPEDIRADRVIIGDVRLPFFKFPRNPEAR